MENYTKAWVYGAIALSLVALVVSFTSGGGTTVVEKVTERLGAAAGPDRTFDCESRNGIIQCFGKQTMRQATTTVCAIRSPVNATSTLVSGLARFSVASTSATTVHLAKASTFNSTTTSLGRYALGAGAQGTFFASTTPDAPGGDTDPLDPNFVFAPGQYFVVGLAGADVASNYVGVVPTGSCNATFEII